MAAGSLSYDVVVVGGGAAGLASAVAAARSGARTALIERYGFLGGMATAGMVSTVCGLYLTAAAGPPEILNEGFANEVARRLATMPGCGGPARRTLAIAGDCRTGGSLAQRGRQPGAGRLASAW